MWQIKLFKMKRGLFFDVCVQVGIGLGNSVVNMRKYFTRMRNHVLKCWSMLANLKSAQYCEITGLWKYCMVVFFVRHCRQSQIQTCSTFDFHCWTIGSRWTMSNKTKYYMQQLSSTRLTVVAAVATDKQKKTWVRLPREPLLWCTCVWLVCSTLDRSILRNARFHSAFCCISFVKIL
jgi:hypothetical protein